MTRALVLGGTGMLAAATRHIALHYDETTLLARHPETLAAETGATPYAINWADRDKVMTLIENLATGPRFDLLLSWVHSPGIWCIPLLEDLLRSGGRSIRIHGSSVGNPAAGIAVDPSPRSNITRQNVVLGHIIENKQKRWLTNAEISQGAINAFTQSGQAALVIGQL